MDGQVQVAALLRLRDDRIADDLAEAVDRVRLDPVAAPEHILVHELEPVHADVLVVQILERRVVRLFLRLVEILRRGGRHGRVEVLQIPDELHRDRGRVIMADGVFHDVDVRELRAVFREPGDLLLRQVVLDQPRRENGVLPEVDVHPLDDLLDRDRLVRIAVLREHLVQLFRDLPRLGFLDRPLHREIERLRRHRIRDRPPGRVVDVAADRRNLHGPAAAARPLGAQLGSAHELQDRELHDEHAEQEERAEEEDIETEREMPPIHDQSPLFFFGALLVRHDRIPLSVSSVRKKSPRRAHPFYPPSVTSPARGYGRSPAD